MKCAWLECGEATALQPKSAGDLGRAIPLYEQTLTDMVRVLGEDHPSTITVRENPGAGKAQVTSNHGMVVGTFDDLPADRHQDQFQRRPRFH